VLDLFTIVWGWMTDLFLTAGLPALFLPNNIPSVKDYIDTYTFYTSGEAKEQIMSNPLYKRLEELVNIIWKPLLAGEWDVYANLKDQMRESYHKGNYMHILEPDKVNGDGSLLSIVKLAQEGYNPILYGFPKVAPPCFFEVRECLETRGYLSNKELVTIGMRHILPGKYNVHQICKSERGTAYYVTHTVPTLTLLPDKKVIDFFDTNPNPNGGFDHVIPYWMAMEGYPWHFIDHSDAYFQVEMATTWYGQGGDRIWHPEMAEEGERFFSQFQQIWEGLP